MLVFRGVNTWSITPLFRGEKKTVSHVFQAIKKGHHVTPSRTIEGVHFVGGGLKGTCLEVFFRPAKGGCYLEDGLPGWNLSG